MDKDVAVLKINKQDYEAIVDTATEGPSDWKSLVKQAEKDEEKYKKGKKKKL